MIFKKCKVIANQLLSKIFGLILVKKSSFIYESRRHPYERIKLIVKEMFNERQINLFEVGGWRGGIIDQFLSLENLNSVVAFEPNKELFQYLTDKYYSDSRVNIYDYGLSNTDELLDLFITKGDNLSSMKKPNDLKFNRNLKVRKKSIVNVVRGDSFVDNNSITEITVLSINCQGFELNVLEGFSSTLKKGIIKSIIIEIDFTDRYSKMNFFDVESMICKYGYELFDINLIKNKANSRVGIEMVDCFYILKSFSN